MKLIFDTLPTPLGAMTAAFSGETLCRLDFNDSAGRIERLLDRRFGSYEKVIRVNPLAIRDRIKAYFKGDGRPFDGLKLETGGTAFQQSVWQALRLIPLGQVISYGQLARNIGKPQAHRAVGAANGANPIAIVIPCHRVIAANGALAGYAGGIERKRNLLKLEGAL